MRALFRRNHPLIPALSPCGGRGGRGKADLQGLAAFRILFSATLLYDFFTDLLPAWKDLLGPGLPYAAGYTVDSVFLRVFPGSLALQYLLLAVYAAALFCLLVGFRARVAAGVGFVLLSGIMARNELVTTNADVLARAFLLWSVFLPVSRRWSMDAALRGEEEGRDWPLIPLLAVRTQIALVYFCSGVFKLAGEPWLSGRAVQYSLGDHVYGTAFGARVAALLPDAALFALAWSITLFQVFFTPLVYMRRTRLFAIAGAALMHVAFIALMRINIFPFVCLSYLFILVPDAWFDRLLAKRRARLGKMKIFYDPGCAFCRVTARLLRELCLSGNVPVLPADTDPEARALLKQHNSWVVRGADGKTYLKWPAVAHVLRQNPLTYIFGLPQNLNALYGLIGRHRSALARVTPLKARTDTPPGCLAQLLCAALALVMASFSLLSLPQSKIPPPAWLQTLARNAGLNQVWSIFAPETAAYIREYGVKAYNARGLPVSAPPPLPYVRDRDGYYLFENHRWQRWHTYLVSSPGVAEAYARWICAKTPGAYDIRLILSETHRYKKDVRWTKTLDHACSC